jgi:hypothetical protein
VTPQNNSLFVSLLAYAKPEKLKFAHKPNHFAFKAGICLPLQKLSGTNFIILNTQLVHSMS